MSRLLLRRLCLCRSHNEKTFYNQSRDVELMETVWCNDDSCSSLAGAHPQPKQTPRHDLMTQEGDERSTKTPELGVCFRVFLQARKPKDPGVIVCRLLRTGRKLVGPFLALDNDL